jgi:hypothetical protein
MKNTLVIGKIYNLEFNHPDENADAEDYLERVKNMAGTYKLIGEGMIPWGDKDIDKCKQYKYYLFKKTPLELIEVFIENDNKYSTLVCYNGVELTKNSYSTYLSYGSLDFPEFYTPEIHLKVNINLSQYQEW